VNPGIELLLRQQFPSLFQDGFEQTSPDDPIYNCIAWAAGDTTNWWWPGISYWPPGVPEQETLAAFIAAYGGIGYEPCADAALEFAFERVVIYSLAGVPTHAARQLDDGAWTSKLGEFWDIKHTTPGGVEGPVYGQASQYLRRRLSPERASVRLRRWAHAWYARHAP